MTKESRDTTTGASQKLEVEKLITKTLYSSEDNKVIKSIRVKRVKIWMFHTGRTEN